MWGEGRGGEEEDCTFFPKAKYQCEKRKKKLLFGHYVGYGSGSLRSVAFVKTCLR